MREFCVGDHDLTQDELGNWFVQASVREGRARVVEGSSATEIVAPSSPAPSADTLQGTLLVLFPSLAEADLRKDGVPRVQAVEAALGRSVTANDVAAAWDVYRRGQE